MPVFFLRLENALKRANEFIEVDKKARALEILCDVLRSRKHRTWQKKHEDIMMKYLELCVELRKSYVAKEGIYQYKIICHQQAYSKTFEDVIRQYIAMADAKAEAARQESQAVVGDEVDDLDNMQTPENILLSAVSSEDTQDRTDRVVLLPWIKFLWETYRNCLDLVKSNARTERLYHDIAHQAFQFCIKYNRKTEFRKLCDNLRMHLEMLKKQQAQLSPQVPHQQQIIVNLSNPESQGMHLETRLVQLDCAIQMELWQEAYKATDDIKRFGLMNLTKKSLKSQLMASYYQKLALVFWKANYPLFHAAALFRLFNLTKDLRCDITSEDVQKMASKVVAATLSIPIPPTRAEIDKLVDTEENIVENHHRNLSSLLGLASAVPTRSSLIRDLKRTGVLMLAYPQLQELYQWLEVEFHPLLLCEKVDKCTKFIETCEACPQLHQYAPAIRDVAVIRLLKEISQVYQVIDCKRLYELCPFATPIQLEHIIVSAARRNDLQVRIDHRNKCFYFGNELRMSQGEEIIEGPHLQSMPSEQFRQQLVTMYSVLTKAKALIEPNQGKGHLAQLKRRIMLAYEQNKVADHKRILDRHDYIERRKEEREQVDREKEEEERKLAEEKQAKLREAQAERMAREAEERARQRKMREDLELKKRMALDQIEKIKQTEAGSKLLDGLNEDDLSKLKLEDLKSRQWKQLEKERNEQLTKQRNFERKIDHFERAKRLEELPLLREAYEEWKKCDKKEWEEMENERIKEIIEDRELALENKERLKRMQKDKTEFMEKIKQMRHATWLEKMEEWTRLKDEERKKKLEERRLARKIERKEIAMKLKKEQEMLERMEREKRIREEEDRKKAEQLARSEQLQRQREREIEEKLNREEEFFKRELKEIKKERDRERENPEKTTNWRSIMRVEAKDDKEKMSDSWRSGPKTVDLDKSNVKESREKGKSRDFPLAGNSRLSENDNKPKSYASARNTWKGGKDDDRRGDKSYTRKSKADSDDWRSEDPKEISKRDIGRGRMDFSQRMAARNTLKEDENDLSGDDWKVAKKR